jgi:hypothetical protein
MKIANLELRIANLVRVRGNSNQSRSVASVRFAIRNSTFAILFLLMVAPVLAQTSATRPPAKVTVTLVRWPYT